MRVNLKNMVADFSCKDKIEFFKQFNLYKNIECEDFIYRNKYIKKIFRIIDKRNKICKVETTMPMLNIFSAKIIETIEGTSLEGQYLSGKKLIIVGKIKLSLIITYITIWNRKRKICRNINIPFSTFIIIPKDICSVKMLNLRYLFEDVSAVKLSDRKVLVSITVLLQYLDEYVKQYKDGCFNENSK